MSDKINVAVTDVINTTSLETMYLKNNYIGISNEVADKIPLQEEIWNLLVERLSAKPIIQHKCHNCGAQVEMDENNHLFKCHYCGAVYFIGTNQINSI